MKRVLLSLALLLSLAGLAGAQDRAQSLADIRSELTRLASDLAALKGELAVDRQSGRHD